jgi:ATP-dependent DNA helicase RecG
MPTGDTEILQQPLRRLKGVGSRRAALLERAGLLTTEDLLYRFPTRYENRAQFQRIADLQPEASATIAGEVISCGLRATRRPGFRIFELLLRDASGILRAIWFNQPFLRNVFQPRQHLVLFGRLEPDARGRLQMLNPVHEIVRDPNRTRAGPAEATDARVHMGRIVPVYERMGTLTPRIQRQIVFEALQLLPASLADPIPAALLRRKNLPDRRRALAQSHFPDRDSPLDQLNAFRTPAQVRLIYEEFFLFQLGLAQRAREASAEHKPHAITVGEEVRAAARRVLPFRLTAAQRGALKEIVEDLQRPAPMNRLLQGDVGAGKTIVALVAAVVAMENGLQVALMAPTEILAEQHYLTIRRLLEPTRFRVALLTGSLAGADRQAAYQEIATGATHLVVGTHALVQEPVRYHRLGLVIIDEQHRFGVLQRAALRAKGLLPDVLVMTATPIPRTLQLTSFGDLDVSIVRDRPPGRQPTRTVVLPDTGREEVHAAIRKAVDEGRQAYVVYPLVEESEKIDLKAATERADHLAQAIFPEFRIGLLHGRMAQEAKDRVMSAFARGEFHILVATTVVEVGMDVPNAAVMVIEHAERFGLSQLHQLRGRVGRGPHPSTCFLVYQPPVSDEAGVRLRTMAETSDGFVIAERDLELRGPGDFAGTRQAGVPTFRMGDLIRDRPLLEEARRDAFALLREQPAEADALIGLVRAIWQDRFGLAGVG